MRKMVNDVRIRWVFCLAVLGVSLLLIGAGRVNGEKRTVSRCTANREACREAASFYSKALPVSSANAWKKLIEKNPELALRAEAGRLYEIGSLE